MRCLVVGGTGMLSGAVEQLAVNGNNVTVVGRSESKMNLMLERLGGFRHRIEPLISDYQLPQKFISDVQSTLFLEEGYDLVIAWIHSSGEDSLVSLMHWVSDFSKPARFFHIVGSSSRIDRLNATQQMRSEGNLLYRKVILGYVRESSGSRWLTDGEISEGVIEAITTDAELFTIGVIRPWSNRP